MEATLPSPVKINWEKLPEPVQHRCCESSRMRRAAARAFAALTVVSAAATAYAFLYFTALPFTVITVVSGLAALTTALTISTVVISRMKALRTDPEILLDQRATLCEQLQKNPGLGFESMRDLCPSLKAFTNEEVNLLLRHDAQTQKKYLDFIDKHGRVLDILDETNMKALRPKLLTHLIEFAVQANHFPLDKILALPPCKKFGIKQEELNALLTSDVEGLSYAAFIDKYGSNVLTIVADYNKSALKLKFYAYLKQWLPLTEHPVNNQGYSLQDIQKSPEWKAFSLTRDVLNDLLREEIKDTPSYVTFVTKYGTNVVLTILDGINLSYLRDSFMQFLIGTCIHDQKLGLEQIMSKPEVKLFQVEEEEVKMLIANRQIQLLMEEKKGFVDFEFALIESITDAAGKAYIVEKYKEYILGLKEQGLLAFEARKKENAVFGPAVTKELHDAILSREFAWFESGHNSYLALRGRNGLDALHEHLTSDKNKELQDKARLSFLSLSYVEISQYKEDHIVLGLTPHDIKQALEKRWNSMKFPDSKFPDLYGFFASMGPGKEFSSREWTKKILEDTKEWSVYNIAFYHPQLFSLQILISTDCLDEGQATIRQRLEKEMENMATFEQFFDHFPVVVLESHLIDSTSPMLSALVKKFVALHPDLYLNVQADTYSTAIAKHKLMSAALSQHIEKMRSDQIAKNNLCYANISKLDDLLTTQMIDANEIRSSTIAQAEKEAGIPGKEALVQQYTTLKSNADKEIESLEEEKLKCEVKKLGLPTTFGLFAKIEALNKELLELSMLNLDERIPPLQLKIGQVQQLIAQSEKAIDTTELFQLRWELSTLQSTIAGLKTTSNALILVYKKQQQRIALEQQRDALAKTVQSPAFAQEKALHQQEMDKPVQGMLKAISAATSTSMHKDALAQLAAKEKQLAKLEQEIAQLPPGNASEELAQIQKKIADFSHQEGLKQAALKMAEQQAMKTSNIAPLKANLQEMQTQLSLLQSQKARMNACAKELTEQKVAFSSLQQEINQLQRKSVGCAAKLNAAKEKTSLFSTKYNEAKAALDASLAKLTKAKAQAEQEFLQSKEKLEKKHQEKISQEHADFANVFKQLKEKFCQLLQQIQ